MSEKKSGKISTLGSQVMSVISVSLVLMIVGILFSMSIVTGKLADSVMGNVSIIIKLDLMASESEAAKVYDMVAASPYAAETVYTSADQVMAKEMEYNADILELLAENPYSAELEVKLNPQYVDPDSVTAIGNQLNSLSAVDEVISQVDMISSLHNISRKATLALSCIAMALLLISIVLIYNTVSIAVYARRFVIRTMQLVGATAGFIRRPFIISGLAWGVISGIIASAAILGAKAYFDSSMSDLGALLHWGDLCGVCAALIALGVAICMIAAFFATSRYLKASYDDLYKS